MVKTNCIEKPLGILFCEYGKFIARHSLWFITVPVIISGALAGGFVFLKSETNVEYLFTPTNGPAKAARNTVTTTFSVNESGQFDQLRLTDLGTYTSIIITSLDGESILRERILKRLIELDAFVRNISVLIDGQQHFFRNICAKWKDQCAEQNVLVSLLDGNASTISDIHLTYPEYVMHIPGIPSPPIPGYPMQTNRTIFLPGVFGGVETDGNQRIVFVKAYKLFYYTETKNDTKATKWVKAFLKFFKDKNFEDIQIVYYSSVSLEEELNEATGQTVSLISVVFTIMITFSIMSCLMLDWVLSKPWLGFLGVVSVALSILSTFGLLMYCGVPFISIVGITPFLSLAIGVDDMFVLLAAWRQTDPQQTVEQRLGQTFRDAGISITITTVTDAFAFGIGAITFYPSVQIFCAYTGLNILLAFAYQVTFFGGCMALIGKREHQNRHSYTCRKVLPKAEAGHKSSYYRLLCAGGYSPDLDVKSTQENNVKTSSHAGMTFFRKYYGPFIMKIPVKIVTVLLYLGYLGTAIYGCTKVEEGLDLRKLALDDSYAIKFYDLDLKYYKEYHANVMLVVNTEVDYSSLNTTNQLNSLVEDLESSGYFAGREFMTSWIHDYLKYLNDYDIEFDKHNFTSILYNRFLLEPAYEKYGLDVVFNHDKSEISRSRIFVQSINMTSTTRDRYMMVTARNIARESALDVVAFHPGFIYYDQYDTVLSNTLQNVGIATGCMFVISLLLIPNPVVALWVFLSIASISAGLLGFMTFWNEKVDSVSMICIVMSIGFSVDFSAHVAYAFSISGHPEPNRRACDALGFLGLPITQGALSTLLGFVVLAAAPSQIFRIYFKILLLVIVIGYMHGILILPIIMSVTGRRKTKIRSDAAHAQPGTSLTAYDNNSLFTGDMYHWIRSICQPTLAARMNGAFDNTDEGVLDNSVNRLKEREQVIHSRGDKLTHVT